MRFPRRPSFATFGVGSQENLDSPSVKKILARSRVNPLGLQNACGCSSDEASLFGQTYESARVDPSEKQNDSRFLAKCVA